jgi:hypothetical protein
MIGMNGGMNGGITSMNGGMTSMTGSMTGLNEGMNSYFNDHLPQTSMYGGYGMNGFRMGNMTGSFGANDPFTQAISHAVGNGDDLGMGMNDYGVQPNVSGMIDFFPGQVASGSNFTTNSIQAARQGFMAPRFRPSSFDVQTQMNGVDTPPYGRPSNNGLSRGFATPEYSNSQMTGSNWFGAEHVTRQLSESSGFGSQATSVASQAVNSMNGSQDSYTIVDEFLQPPAGLDSCSIDHYDLFGLDEVDDNYIEDGQFFADKYLNLDQMGSSSPGPEPEGDDHVN